VFWRTVGRIIVVAFALLLATAATMFVLITLGLERITGVLHQRAVSDNDMVEAMFNVMNQGLLLSTGFTVIPALLVVFIGEIARIRSALYYVAGGGLSLAAMPLLARFGPGSASMGVAPDQVVWQVFATAGFAGGLVYWLVAGRNA
jgi:hypothetical protein